MVRVLFSTPPVFVSVFVYNILSASVIVENILSLLSRGRSSALQRSEHVAWHKMAGSAGAWWKRKSMALARGPFYMGWRTTLSDTYLICFLIVKPLTKKVNSRNLHRRHFNSDPLIVTHHHILMLTCVCSVWDKSLVSNIRQTINFHFLMVPPYKNHSYEQQFVNRQAASSGC